MRITVDVPPGSWEPPRAALGTDCNRFDHVTLAIGTGPTPVKRESPGHSVTELARLSIRRPS